MRIGTEFETVGWRLRLVLGLRGVTHGECSGSSVDLRSNSNSPRHVSTLGDRIKEFYTSYFIVSDFVRFISGIVAVV